MNLSWTQHVSPRSYRDAHDVLARHLGRSGADQALSKLRDAPVSMKDAKKLHKTDVRDDVGLSNPKGRALVRAAAAGNQISPVLVVHTAAGPIVADGRHRIALAAHHKAKVAAKEVHI